MVTSSAPRSMPLLRATLLILFFLTCVSHRGGDDSTDDSNQPEIVDNDEQNFGEDTDQTEGNALDVRPVFVAAASETASLVEPAISLVDSGTDESQHEGPPKNVPKANANSDRPNPSGRV